MKVVPLRKGVLTREQEVEILNEVVRTLHWISPVLNRDCGKAEPGAEYLRDGMLAYANGTDWNPGAGEGLYRYDEGSVSWVRIG